MKKLVFLFIGALLFSCQSELLHDFSTSNKRNHQRTSFRISKEEAIALSLGFANELNVKTRGGGYKEVESVIPWRLHDMYRQTKVNNYGEQLPDTMLYIVNFKNNDGFVLVPTDNRIKGILAYVEEGNLSPSDQIDNEGFNFFLSRLPDYFLEQVGDPFFELDTLPYPGLLDPWVTDSLIEPMLTTTWHQFSPFNDSCPVINGNPTLAGCLPIATCQLLAYHQYPNTFNGHTYNWSEILTGAEPQTNVGKNNVAQLIHDVGVLLQSAYVNNGTFSSPDNLLCAFDSLGYEHPSTWQNYDFNISMQSFEAGCPVIMTGSDSLNVGGHAWVIDGGAIRRDTRFYIYPGEPAIYQYLIHCNWGWPGTPSFNGYYKSGVFDTRKKVADVLTRSHAYYDCEIFNLTKPLEE